MCRELSFEEQQNIVHQNPKCLSFISQRDSYKAIFTDEHFTKKMLHGPATACMLYSSYNISQFDILEAVALHSIADETMSQCAKIIFISDKLEPLREQRHDAQKNLNTLPLNDLFIYTIACVKSWFSESGMPILPYTSDIYSRILNK
jgi:HD superfamily phosphohydrolase YqeK